MAGIGHSVSIDAPRERVFRLIASERGVARWWTGDVIEDDSAGVMEAGFFNTPTAHRLKPIPNSISWTTEWMCHTGQVWTGTRLLFELTETNGKTQLVSRTPIGRLKTDYFVLRTQVWGELMHRLKAAAEGERLGPTSSKGSLAS
jgi:uncharacterized protein YndB with AHSA1/START domain